MDTSFAVPLRIRPLAFLHARRAPQDNLTLESNDSALCALTDFQRQTPFTVKADQGIEDAVAAMNKLRVHALLVTRQDEGGGELEVVGLITYYDIDRAHRHPRFGEHSGVRVGDVMASCDELALVNYGSLEALTAFDLYEMFQGTGLTHLLVVEMHGSDSTLARGLLSRAALAKALRRSSFDCSAYR